MSAEIDIDAGLSAGNFSAVNEWNRVKIWQYGKLYRPGELLDRPMHRGSRQLKTDTLSRNSG